MKHINALAVASIAGLFTVGCNVTNVDDAGNFKRIHGFDKPPNVQVVHSYYSETRKLTYQEIRYYIALRVKGDLERFVKQDSILIPPSDKSRKACGSSPPDWFVPKPATHYETWAPKYELQEFGDRVFRDKDDGTFYLCLGRRESE